MTKRSAVGLVYFVVVLMTLLLRVSSALGVYDVLGVDGDIYFTLVVQVLIFGVLPIIAYFLIAKKQTNEGFLSIAIDFGCKKLSGRNFLRAVVIGIGMIFVSSLISYVWQPVLYLMGYKSTSSPTNYSNIGVLFSELFFVALLPGVFEEITHRGLIFAGYRETGWRFVIVSALLFSLMHQNIAQAGYTFFDGVIIALVMYYTGSILPGICIHFLNNAVSVTEGYIAQNGGFLSFIMDIQNWFFASIGGFLTFVALGLIVMVLMLYMFKRMRIDGIKNGIVPKDFFNSGVSNDMLNSGAPKKLQNSDVPKKLQSSGVSNDTINSDVPQNLQSSGVSNDIINSDVPKNLQNSGANDLKKSINTSALPLHKDVFFIATVALGVAATIFSLVWGIIR